MIDPVGRPTTTQYDALRRRTGEQHWSGTTANSTLMSASVWEYNAAGRPVIERRADSINFQTITSWQSWATAYTPTGQVESSTDPAGDQAFTIYDALDRPIRAIDAAGRASANFYDAAGQLLQERRGSGTPLEQAFASYTYTPNGQRASASDGRANVIVAYTYDGFDRPSQSWYGDGTHEQTDYDAASQPVMLTNRQGLRTATTFDALGRRTHREGLWYDGTPTLATWWWSQRPAEFSYDLAGRMTSASTDEVSQSWVFDAAGRPASSARSWGGSFSYGWDGANNLTTLTDPTGAVATYGYDGLNRMVSASSSIGGSATIEYDTLSRRTQITFGDGSSQAYGYEADDDLSSIAHHFPARTSDDGTFAYNYDPAGRLVSMSISNPVYAWNPPASGPGAPIQSYGFVDAANRYYSVDGSPVSFWAQGGAGQILGFSHFYGEDGRRHFTQDLSDPTYATYDYSSFDALGQRFWSDWSRPNATDEGLLTLTDGIRPEVTDEVLHELPEGGQWSGLFWRYHVLGPNADERLFTIDRVGDGPVRYPHTDRQGSTIALSRAGTADIRLSYGPFGETPSGVTWATGAASYAYRYTGQREERFAPGLYDYKARSYSPNVGRFLQPDPLGVLPGNSGGSNLYEYVVNDPLDRTDPTGQDAEITRFDDERRIRIVIPVAMGTRQLNFDRISAAVRGLSQTVTDSRGNNWSVEFSVERRDLGADRTNTIRINPQSAGRGDDGQTGRIAGRPDIFRLSPNSSDDVIRHEVGGHGAGLNDVYTTSTGRPSTDPAYRGNLMNNDSPSGHRLTWGQVQLMLSSPENEVHPANILERLLSNIGVR